jgi:hypothetical protein
MQTLPNRLLLTPNLSQHNLKIRAKVMFSQLVVLHSSCRLIHKGLETRHANHPEPTIVESIFSCLKVQTFFERYNNCPRKDYWREKANTAAKRARCKSLDRFRRLKLSHGTYVAE